MKPKSTTTGPRPKTKTARKSKPDWLDCLDRIYRSCHTLEMLGGLLGGQGDERLNAEVVREAGGLLEDHMKLLRKALTDLEAAR
jgi:hypothetical protein